MAYERTSVTVDMEKAKRVMEMGFDLSPLLREAIDTVLSGDNDDLLYAIRLRRVEEETQKIEMRIFDLNEELKFDQERREYLRQEHIKMEQEWEHTKYVIQLTRLVNRLNRIALSAEYDIPTIVIVGKEVIDGIKELNPSFDLNKQIEKLRMLMET